MTRTVTLTDHAGNALGQAPLLQAHLHPGMLHRAFSVYVFRDAFKEVLMQKRAKSKMLWGGYWANTCCSHPHEQESPEQAGERRLREELGFTLPLRVAGSFVYRAEDPRGAGVEHEHVTLLLGEAPGEIELDPNPSEVEDVRWALIDELLDAMKREPDEYTPWFHQGLQLILKKA